MGKQIGTGGFPPIADDTPSMEEQFGEIDMASKGPASMRDEQTKTMPDIFDLEPNIGSTTPEPALRKIIFLYYNAHFGITESKGLTEDYIKELVGLTAAGRAAIEKATT